MPCCILEQIAHQLDADTPDKYGNHLKWWQPHSIRLTEVAICLDTLSTHERRKFLDNSEPLRLHAVGNAQHLNAHFHARRSQAIRIAHLSPFLTGQNALCCADVVHRSQIRP